MKLNSRYVLKDLGAETFVIIDKENTVDMNEIMSLNNSGVLIFNSINKGLSDDEIINLLCNEYDVSEDVIKADYYSFIGKLKDKAIVYED